MEHKIVPLASLIIPDGRQRETFDEAALLELATSIDLNGLLHAIVVRHDGKTIVAGERRLRAIRQHLLPLGRPVRYSNETMPTGHVPVVLASSDDPLALEEIELAENLHRRDLSWQELAKTTARIDALRRKQAAARAEAAFAAGAVSRPEADAIAASHTVAKTAEEVRGSSVGDYQTVTRNEIIVARHLDNPEVAAAPTLKDAFKVIKRIEDADRNRALAVAVGQTFHAGLHQVYNANCLEWMAKPEWQGKFDVICTDPPYGMGAHQFGDGAGRLDGIEHHYDDSLGSWRKLMFGEYQIGGDSEAEPFNPGYWSMTGWCSRSFAVAKPEAHAYVWCDFDRFHELKAGMEAAGWYVFRTPLINVKRNSGRVPLPDKGPRRQYEICLYAIKGNKLTRGIFSDVIQTDADEQMSHGAQKPVALYDDLLRRSCRPGDWVLDSFAGTGPLLPAANALQCVAVCVEQNQTYYGKCLERAKSLTAQAELPV